MDVASWLRNLSLEQYETVFRENAVTADVLCHLTNEDLRELGVSAIGHRRRLLVAIASLQADGPPAGDPARPSSDPPISPTNQPGTAETTAERRPLSVMFCDLIGSTALSSRLDPEDLREVIRAYQTRVGETIQQFDGFIARYVGDGVLIYFGWPEARETDAERAVRAGLAVAATVSATPVRGEPLQVRIGIATGLVVIGEPIGAGDSRQQTAVGETPNLAARQQGLAEPGQVVIDAATRRLIGGLFECRDLGMFELKGLPAKVRAWQVLSENRRLGQFEALRSGATPLIGRDEEMELLLRRWEQAKAGNGRVVLISAEPGVGKSRLAEALAERIGSEPHTRLRYFCSPHHQDSALYPVIAQMERAAGFVRSDEPAAKIAKLQALLATTAPPTQDVALIAELVSLPPGDLAPPLDVTPQRKKEKIFEALLFDDLQWIDPGTREMLDRLVELVAGWPILLLAMFRPEFQPPWVGQPHVTLLALPRLDRRDTGAMVASVAGDAALAREIVEKIAERTDGVPLFVEELTKSVLEFSKHAPAALCAAPLDLSVPTTLHASLMARLDRLGPAAKEVAQTGAAIGRAFGFELLALAGDLPEPQLCDALDRLTNAGLLFVSGTPPGASYIFKHALVQDAAYGTMLRSRHQRLHGRIATSLESRFPEFASAQPALLAQHCAAAGLTEKAVDYWLKAGQQAMARPALTEAVAQLRKGLEVLADLPDGPECQQLELDLQIALGSALAAMNGIGADDVGVTITRARILAEQLDRPQNIVPLLFGQWRFRSVRSEHKLALAHAEELEKFGEGRNDFAALLLAHRAHGQSCCYLGEFVAARARLERCLVLSDPTYRATGGVLSDDPYITVLAYLGVTSAYLGYIDQARSRIDEALLETRRLKHAVTLATVLLWAIWTEVIIGSSEMEGHVDELLALSRPQPHTSPNPLLPGRGLPLVFDYATVNHGRCLILRGQTQEGLALLMRGLAAIRATGSAATTSIVLMWAAEAHAKLGQPSEALDRLAEASQVIETTEERCHEAELHRLQGDFLLAAGDLSAAELNYHRSLAVARSQSARLLELRVSTNLARLWAYQGKRAEACDLLGPIYDWFTEGFDAPDLKDARALLDELTWK